MEVDRNRVTSLVIGSEWRIPEEDSSEFAVLANGLAQLVEELHRAESITSVGPILPSAASINMTSVPGSFATAANPQSYYPPYSHPPFLASSSASGVVAGADSSLSVVDIEDVGSTVARLFDPETYAMSRWASNSSQPSYATTKVSPSTTQKLSTVDKLMGRIPGCTPVDGLLWQLAVRLADAISPLRTLRFQHGVSGFLKAVWREVVLEVESAWREGTFLVGVGGQEPSQSHQSPPRIDLRYALVEQKLEMVNCCVFVKRKWGGAPMKRSPAASTTIAGQASHSPQATIVGNIGEPFASTEAAEAYRSLFSGLGSHSPTETVIPEVATQAVGRGAQKLRSLLSDFADVGAATGGAALVKLFDRITEERSTPGQAENWHVGPLMKSPPQAPTLMRSSLATDPARSNSWDLDERDLWPHEHLVAGASTSGDEKSSAVWSDDDDDDDVFFDSVQGPSSAPDGSESFSSKPSSSITNTLAVQSRAEPLPIPSSLPKDSTTVDGSFQSHGSFIDVNQSSFGKRQPLHHPSLDRSEHSSLEVSETNKDVSMELSISEERVGHLRPLRLKLLNTGEEMWEPEVQDTGFLTEDMLREQEKEWERSADTGERVHSQLKGLESDMEAFKAANPGAVLGDFVRWHSPRDWVERADGSFELSARMRDPGNLWEEIWERAKRVPAARQAPLFDCEREAQNAIEYLKSISEFELLV
ncbi:Rab3 GTPase-activating protein catalytic subunit, partial [Gonapodya sp. JEL0774]